MALRIRPNGRILCAAMFPAEPGDIYIDDGLHYHLSVEARILVTESHEQHSRHGEWWWRGREPDGVVVDGFYKEGSH